MSLTLERRTQIDHTPRVGAVLITPPINEDYWAYRVKLNDRQAVVGFPKFGTIGIGFAVEDDWNTNLPYTCQTIEIVSHLWHNVDSDKPEGDEFGEVKGDDITVAEVYAAVGAIQDAIALDHPDWKPPRSQAAIRQPLVEGVA